MYSINVKTEVLPLSVMIEFLYGKLVKTTMFIFTINGIFLCTGKSKVPLMVNIKHHGFYLIYHMGNKKNNQKTTTNQ